MRTSKSLEKAAKYVCTLKCGGCPSAVEDFPCPRACTPETLPWQCWVEYFKKQGRLEPPAK